MPGWHLEQVISGGQTGADQAGISAAKFLEYKTGGRAPKDFLTERGKEGWLAEFGLVASPVSSLKSRTFHNVTHSDATVLFTPLVVNDLERLKKEYKAKKWRTTEAEIRAYAKFTPGTLYTFDLCVAHRKNCIVNPVDDEQLRSFIYQCDVKVLNVAGSRESLAPGMFGWVYDYLVEALVPF